MPHIKAFLNNNDQVVFGIVNHKGECLDMVSQKIGSSHWWDKNNEWWKDTVTIHKDLVEILFKKLYPELPYNFEIDNDAVEIYKKIEYEIAIKEIDNIDFDTLFKVS